MPRRGGQSAVRRRRSHRADGDRRRNGGAGHRVAGRIRDGRLPGGPQSCTGAIPTPTKRMAGASPYEGRRNRREVRGSTGPCVVPTSAAQQRLPLLDAALEARTDAHFKRRQVPDWALRTIDSDRAWQGLGAYQDADDRWESCRHFQALAFRVSEEVEAVRHVPDRATRLLTADDGDLLAEAERVACDRIALRQLGHPFHPREMDPATIRRRLRVEVSHAAVWCAQTLGLIGGPPNDGLPAYADDWSVDRFEQKCAANAAFLETKVAERPADGFQVSLAEAALSAARATRSMWYSIVLGMSPMLTPLFQWVGWKPRPFQATWNQGVAGRLESEMLLFDKNKENAEAIRRVGERAVEEAKKLGGPCHYMDPALCDGIIRKMPDGTRQHVELQDGEEIVVATFGPRPG